MSIGLVETLTATGKEELWREIGEKHPGLGEVERVELLLAALKERDAADADEGNAGEAARDEAVVAPSPPRVVEPTARGMRCGRCEAHLGGAEVVSGTEVGRADAGTYRRCVRCDAINGWIGGAVLSASGQPAVRKRCQGCLAINFLNVQRCAKCGRSLERAVLLDHDEYLLWIKNPQTPRTNQPTEACGLERGRRHWVAFGLGGLACLVYAVLAATTRVPGEMVVVQLLLLATLTLYALGAPVLWALEQFRLSFSIRNASRAEPSDWWRFCREVLVWVLTVALLAIAVLVPVDAFQNTRADGSRICQEEVISETRLSFRSYQQIWRDEECNLTTRTRTVEETASERAAREFVEDRARDIITLTRP